MLIQDPRLLGQVDPHEVGHFDYFRTVYRGVLGVL